MNSSSSPLHPDYSTKKVLIIKTGRTELFHPELWHQNSVSLGEVLRFGALLRCFCPSTQIDWLTSTEALPLLKTFYQAPNIHLFDCTTDQIEKIDYDLIVNLEIEFVAALSKFNSITMGLIESSDRLQFVSFNGKPFSLLDSWQENFFQLTQHHLPQKEPPSIRPEGSVIGLNWLVGEKLPEKKLKESFWKDLYCHLDGRFNPTWQKGERNLHDYIAWLKSADFIFTHDSLGLHLAHELEIPTICFLTKTLEQNLPQSKIIKYMTLDNSLDHLPSSLLVECLVFIDEMRGQEFCYNGVP